METINEPISFKLSKKIIDSNFRDQFYQAYENLPDIHKQDSSWAQYVSYANNVEESNIFSDVDHQTTLKLVCGKNSHIVYNLGTQESSIRVKIKNKAIDVPLKVNLADLHSATAMYDYCITELDKISTKEAAKSPLLDLKIELEKWFNALVHHQTRSLDVGFDQEYMSYLPVAQQVAKVEAVKSTLLEKDLIPKEGKIRKYPTNLKAFMRKMPFVVNRYAKYKRNQQRKAQIKQAKKEIKLAKKQERLYFKAHKKEIENNKNNINIDNSISL